MISNISRKSVFEQLCIERLSRLNVNEIRDIFFEMQKVYDEKSTSDQTVSVVVLELIKFEYKGAPNSYLAQVYSEIIGEKVTVYGDLEHLFPCPCCKAKSLTELYDPIAGTGYDICENCGWEDDGTSSLDTRSSVNRGTINQYLAMLHDKKNEIGVLRWEFEN